MGWRELRAWLGVMGRQTSQSTSRPDPNRWTAASRDNFAELDEKRRKLRGR